MIKGKGQIKKKLVIHGDVFSPLYYPYLFSSTPISKARLINLHL